MSAADEMALKGPRRAAELINEAVGELQQAQRLLRETQGKVTDTWLWHQLESIDDRLHEALGKLGD